MTTEGEGLNPFEAFDNAVDMYAFMHSEYGADSLRELLATGPSDKESLEHDAAELRSLGLNAAADIVAEAAEQAPSGEVCPFDPETEKANHWDWYARQDRKAISRNWSPLPDHLYGCCNGLKPRERPQNWPIATKPKGPNQ